MSERLPYFKFFASIYLAADITLLPYEVQGIFNNASAFYWTKGCKVKLEKIKRHLLKNPDVKATPEKIDTALDLLISEGIIKHEKKTDYIRINFQDEQLVELSATHEKNSANGAKGAEKRWKKGEKKETGEHFSEPEKTVEIVNAEKKRLAEFKTRFMGTIDAPESIVRNHKGVKLEQVPTYLDKFNNHLSASRVPFQFSEYRTHFNNWMFNCERIEAASGENKNKLSYSLTKKKPDQ